ncbi:MAG: DUF4149 domain-containing protein [Acidimicrobiia bacterium]|nr:DUF4149 domain-containing protein [Acidimicrobiia bacterium]
MTIDWLRFGHLLGAAVWTGGLVVLAFVVTALRRAGAERPHLQAMAKTFGRVSWTAMALALVTGVIQVLEYDREATNPNSPFGRALFVKLLLVGLAAALALGHQMTAGSASPRARGIVQALILLVSVGIFAAATAL